MTTARPRTTQGRATRDRILAEATRLVAERGPAATSVDDVLAATATSKSQLYHYFGDKRGLILAVVEWQIAAVLGDQVRVLAAVDDWEGLRRWSGQLVAEAHRRGGRGGCPIGTLAAALADTDEPLRQELSAAFRAWSDAIAAAFGRLRDRGLLTADADVSALAASAMAAIQGGLLLAKTTRDCDQLRASLDGVLDLARGL